MNAVAVLGGNAGERHDAAAVGIGLWVFMGVVTTLFSLFISAYVMRMDASDWSVIAMPWQLWLSTALLLAGSATLQLASRAASRATMSAHWAPARTLLLAGGACALAFLAVQLWAWQALLAIRVVPAGNPAASFFYLLTALHGLHVAGGLVAWGLTARGFLRDGGDVHEVTSVGAIVRSAGPPQASTAPSGGSAAHVVASVGATSHAWRIALCARYWHFLLALWLLLFATLGGLTPEVVRFICGN
ncbi:bb3-type cytochrome oxidase subunit III [Polaromonas sp. P2-4]|nr:bb3-type cytochrome oxidase subunit III [Polaromonas sp. P2-4]